MTWQWMQTLLSQLKPARSPLLHVHMQPRALWTAARPGFLHVGFILHNLFTDLILRSKGRRTFTELNQELNMPLYLNTRVA